MTPQTGITGAIIGCGRIVQEHHIPAWIRLGREAVAHWTVCDTAMESRLAAQMALGVPNEHAYRDHRALLLREKPDFAVVSTPHVSHETIVMDCIRSGVPVLVEKPMAATLRAAERMARAAEEAGLPLSVIHNYRARPQAEVARKLLAAGAIGRPFLFRSEGLGMGWSPGAEGTDEDWRTRLDLAGGGCLLDNGYHSVYMARDFLGPVASVFARVCTCNRPIEVDDTALLLMAHENGATTSVQVAWSMAGESIAVNEVYGTEGTMRLEPDGTVCISRDGREWERHPAPPGSGFIKVFQNFLDTIHGHGVPCTTAREAVENLRIVRAAYASSNRHQPVDVATYTED